MILAKLLGFKDSYLGETSKFLKFVEAGLDSPGCGAPEFR
jgi:hypothetical protein